MRPSCDVTLPLQTATVTPCRLSLLLLLCGMSYVHSFCRIFRLRRMAATPQFPERKLTALGIEISKRKSLPAESLRWPDAIERASTEELEVRGRLTDRLPR
jgi:hypothetical protein